MNYKRPPPSDPGELRGKSLSTPLSAGPAERKVILVPTVLGETGQLGCLMESVEMWELGGRGAVVKPEGLPVDHPSVGTVMNRATSFTIAPNLHGREVEDEDEAVEELWGARLLEGYEKD